uniref:Uncharacterized protein n=1 Tax=Setaria digitata TaxID=48799 RepID=A0A915PH08_9BILA
MIDEFDGSNRKVNEFTDRLHELRVALSELREICIFISQCEKLSNELEGERRSHADELRQINQDINHLEDTFKSLKNGNDAKKDSIAQKYREIERDLDRTNEILCESGITETDLLTNDILFPSQFDEMIDSNATNHLALTTPLVLNQLSHLSFLEMLNRHRNHILEASDRIMMSTSGTVTATATATASVTSIIPAIGGEPTKMKVQQILSRDQIRLRTAMFHSGKGEGEKLSN